MSKKIKNEKTKYALITGAYGGMGYKTVKELASNGFTVFALDKRVKEAEENVVPIEADITDTESLRLALDKVTAVTKELHAIVHLQACICLTR